MPPSPDTWVRTRVTNTTKNKVRRVAAALGWNIPGVECACIELVFTLFTPDEMVDLITRSLSPADDDGQETEETRGKEIT